MEKEKRETVIRYSSSVLNCNEVQEKVDFWKKITGKKVEYIFNEKDGSHSFRVIEK